MSPPRIFLSPPQLGLGDREAVLSALDSGWVAPAGPELGRFEQALCRWSGAAHALAVSSGSAGLHLALRAVGLKPGDRVISPTLSFAACAFAIRYLGAEPVFVDVNPEDWQQDFELVREACRAVRSRGDRVGAVLAVDLYGQVGALDELERWCAAEQIPLVEDAAEALGAGRLGADGEWRAAGRWGRAGIYSFNGNKILTCSGGGVVVTDEEELDRAMRCWSSQAREPVAHFEHRSLGYNYRLSNILAALGRSQMDLLESRVAAKKEIFSRYREGLADIDGLEWMPVPAASRPNYWLSCLLLPSGCEPEALRLALEQDNIESRRLWKPLHRQPVFRDVKSQLNGVSEKLWERGICLPSGCGLTKEDQDRVIQRVRSYLCNGLP